MSQYACQNVLMPSTVLSHFIVVHAQFGFCFLEALLYSPTDTAQPDEDGSRVLSGALLI